MASDELISHTNVAGNLIKPMLCASKPLKHQKVRRFLMFSTGAHFSTRHMRLHMHVQTHMQVSLHVQFIARMKS